MRDVVPRWPRKLFESLCGVWLWYFALRDHLDCGIVSRMQLKRCRSSALARLGISKFRNGGFSAQTPVRLACHWGGTKIVFRVCDSLRYYYYRASLFCTYQLTFHSSVISLYTRCTFARLLSNSIQPEASSGLPKLPRILM